MKGYLIYTSFLADGSYRFNSGKHWCEKLRGRLILWLFNSLKKNVVVVITTTSGTETKSWGTYTLTERIK